MQIWLNGWDVHANATGHLPSQCQDVDQACYGLVQDLKQRGMLDDTLLVWGGEFGRTIYSQGQLDADKLRPRSPPAMLHHVDGRGRVSRAELCMGKRTISRTIL